jgi:hypothetical protein
VLRQLRDELWPIEIRDMTQADGSLAIGRLTIGASDDAPQLGGQHLVEPRPALGPNVVGELAEKLVHGLPPKFQRHQFARVGPA